MDENQAVDSRVGPPEGTTSFQLGIRLQPVENSDQPLFANFSVVQATPEVLFLDFGFLEPSMMPALARQAQSGGKMPEAVTGRLTCRVALGRDAAAQLAQQLNRQLAAGSVPAAAPTRVVREVASS